MKAVYISLALIGLGVASLLYKVNDEKVYSYNITDFIEPQERFLTCNNVDDCFKFKGSACPADRGGAEVCINKNFVQEYNSIIEDQAGMYYVTQCPNISLSTNVTCDCVDNRCSLSGEDA